MNERKKQIIETAISLFAKKGFYSTSIQEIADKSGVSKGTVYLHFQSKDELILKIFRYYFNKIREKMMKVEKEVHPPKEKFIRQLTVNYQGILEHKDFIMMLLREQAVPMNDDINRLMSQMRMEVQKWYEENLIGIYGEDVVPYIYDMGLILEGIRNAFFQLLIMGSEQLEPDVISTYIVNQCDVLVHGMLTGRAKPLLNKEMIAPILEEFHHHEKYAKEAIVSDLIKMQKVLGELQIQKDKEELDAAIDFLLTEVKKSEPRKFIIKGMLANFGGIKELKRYREHIAELLDVDLV